MSALLHHGAKHLRPSTSGGPLKKVASSQKLQRQESIDETRVSTKGSLGPRDPSSHSLKKTVSGTSSGTTIIVHAPSPAPPKTRAQRWRKSWKDFYRDRHLKYLIPLFFIALYMIVGALIFIAIESSSDLEKTEQRQKSYNRERELFVRRMEEILRDRAAQRPIVRRKFLLEALDHFHKQMGVEFNLESEWSMWTALYFAGTLFTTIGYGDVACSTPLGRFATVVYAFVGIPIMLITLNDLGKFFYKSTNEFLDFAGRQFDCCARRLKRKRIKPDQNNIDAVEKGELLPKTSILTNDVPLIEPPPDEDEMKKTVSFNLKLNSTDESLEMIVEDGEKPLPLPKNIIIDIDPADDSVFYDDGEKSIGTANETMEEELEPQHTVIRMPVWAALTVTIGWIFICAGIFTLWEEWTYTESIYFMFISLSTIGLGDIIVKRRDLMVLCFFFVITGLSLVSMCINVVQQAIEEWYKNLLMQLLTDYQNKLAAGGDHKGASMGMMKMWGGNKMAKFMANKMMSAKTKRQVMQQIQEEAKESGIDIPPIFEEMDAKTGMPKILVLAQESKQPEKAEEQAALIDELVRQSDPTRTSIPSRSPLPTVVCYETDTQTDILMLDEKAQQTMEVESLDSGIQTDSTEPDVSDEQMQTDELEMMVEETQTNSPDVIDSQTMTHIVTTNDTEIQTTIFESHEMLVQTEPPSVSDVETQFEAEPTVSDETQTTILEFSDSQTMTHIVVMDNKDIQTLEVESIDSSIQTDVKETSLAEAVAQTEPIGMKLQETQTPVIETKDFETNTHVINLHSTEMQTEKVLMKEQMLQTHIYDVIDNETNTEQIETKNVRIQTPVPDFVDTQMQTDPIGRVVPSRVTEAKRRIQRALRSRSRQGRDKRRVSVADPSMSNWRDVSSSMDEADTEPIPEKEGEKSGEESHESLDWDPVDGLHAERQRPVRDLRKKFDSLRQKLSPSHSPSHSPVKK